VVVRRGEIATIGRSVEESGPTDAPHVGLSENPRLHTHAATVTVDAGGWVLANAGRWLNVRVVEADGPNRLDVGPGRSLRVPYPVCELEIALGDEVPRLKASCPLPDGVTDGPPPAGSGSTVSGLGLDPGTGYFLALVALCEPRLRDPQCAEVASVGQIVARLNHLSPPAERVTPKAVERRLAHVRAKLGVGGVDEHGLSAAGLEVRDAARQVVELVLRTGTVTAADLARLDPGGPVAP
jgi:hypothetical protein